MPPLINKESILARIGEGIKYVFRHEMLISALALDLFAVLFGGAIALLPVFADKILNTGAEGLGYLRASPAIGSVLMSLVLVYYPPNKNSGKKLLWCVAGFGLCMILFALSPFYFLSFFLLFMSGMFDSVSVVIRSTIVQKFAPEHMRGRVEAVNRIFIGSSNEIGAFESGAAAKIMGLIPSVVFGGFMTLGVVIVAAFKAKGLRKLEL